MGARQVTDRKRLGQFYTPASEAEILAAWAIRSSKDRILEPSVGDGALLIPALAYARSLGRECQTTALACDVDSDAVDALKAKLGNAIELHCRDFLELNPHESPPVDVVLANPPFTRNHELSKEKREQLRKRFTLTGAAGLWAYFVLHARNFLRPGGRMAIVVPGAATFTHYGANLLTQLQSDFEALSLLEFSTKPAWIWL